MRRLIVSLVATILLGPALTDAPAHAAAEAGWRPSITLRLHWKKTDAGGRQLIAAGTTSYAGNGRVRLEMRTAGQWHGLGYLALSSGRFRGTPPKGMPGAGVKIRVRLPATRHRLRATAVAVVPAPQSYRVALNDAGGVLIEGPQPLVTVLVAASAGDRVSLGGGWQQRMSVTAPDGSLLLDRSWSRDFVADAEGDYRITFPGSQSGGHPLYASTPKQVTAQLGDTIDPVPDLPGQLVDVRFTGEPGQPFVDTASLTAHELVTASGEPLAPWLVPREISGPTIYRLDGNGSVTVRVTDHHPGPIRLRPALELTASLDAPATTFELPDAGSVAVVSIDIPAGQPFTLHSDEFFRGFGWFYDPDDTDLREPLDPRHPDPAPGVYHLVVGDGPGSKSVQFTRPVVVATALDAAPTAVSTEGYSWQWVWQTFTATAGDVVRPTATADGLQVSELTALVGPDGQVVAPDGDVWQIPASGDYHFEWNLFGGWSGELSVARVTPG
ncbi:hypothetical protein [Nocardioides sp.]|uniref:hypothetical protein n=1 Tax=Nocardioides sp. TaxID=35761 RepID=UPI0035270861